MMTTREKANEICEKINERFEKEDFGYTAFVSFKNEFIGYCVEIDIEWGDWKHDHLCADALVEEVMKPSLSKKILTEENGSDCYSAIHEYYYF